MEIINNRKVNNRRNSFIETCVKGIRAEKEFWLMCDKVAEEEQTTRNELIVRTVAIYCKGKNKDGE